jgi:hypothetical protein
MKKILLTLFILIFGAGVFAADQDDALKFFNSFVNASNTYSSELLKMYSDDAKIIRQVVKPDGKQVNVPFDIETYKGQIRISGKLAKIKNYKNTYSNVRISKVSNGYKIEASRQPSLGGDKLKSAMIVQKQPNGKWIIIEELMQTREQIFLKYAKK